jgi:hypothetical protein
MKRRRREDRSQVGCRRLRLRLAEWSTRLIDGRKDAQPMNQTYEVSVQAPRVDLQMLGLADVPTAC